MIIESISQIMALVYHFIEDDEFSDDLLGCTQDNCSQPIVQTLNSDDDFYDDLIDSPAFQRELCEAAAQTERKAKRKIVLEDESHDPTSVATIATVDEQKSAKQLRKADSSSSIGMVRRDLKFFFDRPNLSHVSEPQEIKDTDDTCYLRVGPGGKEKMYKRGETFSCRHGANKERLQGYCFTISKFKTKGRRKHAVCPPGHVVISLKNTFIGQAEAERLLALNTDISDKAVCANTMGILSAGMIELQNLTRQETTIDTKPELVWDCGRISKNAVGLNFAYRTRSPRSVPAALNRKPVVLELFAGCGGMSAGLIQAGFHVKYAVEKDAFAAASLRANHQRDDMQIFEEDVNEFLKKVEVGDACYPKRGDIDHVHASPPCQGFSLANRNGGRHDKANNDLTYRFVDTVRICRPKTATMEIVDGILRDHSEKVKASTKLESSLPATTSGKKKARRHYLQRVVAELIALGYQVRVIIIDASHYGDPQNRTRVFVIAALMSCKLPEMPKATHGAQSDSQHLQPYVTVLDRLADLEHVVPVSGSGWVRLMDGSMVCDHNKEGTSIPTEYDQLIAEEPARTIRRSNGVKHYALERGLTVRERARLQSFPDSHHFCGPLSERNNQIGNAVPVNLATAVAQAVMASHLVRVEAKENAGRLSFG